ncbi:MAG: polysaccharide pyruvyl transferase family protein [Patescibacteria group bacterium]
MNIVICGNYGVKNIGDEAILEGLKTVIGEALPDAKVEVMGKGRLFPFGIRSFIKAIFHPQLWLKPYRMARSCDVFILGGGGLLSDEEGPFVALFWTFHGLMAKWLKKPVLCVGLSVGSLHWLSKIFVKRLLRSSSLVTVRDIPSQKFLTSWGVQSHKVPDLSFWLKADLHIQEPANKYVAISLRSYKKFDAVLNTIFVQLCNFLVKENGFNIILIPFADGQQNDVHILSKLCAQPHLSEHIKLIVYKNIINDLLQVIIGAEFVIGTRFHAGILSIISGTPVIPISYMQKVKDFWSEFPEVKVFDLEKLNFAELKSAVQNIISNRKHHVSVMEGIRKKLEKEAEKSKNQFVAILKMMKGKC